MWSPVSNRSMFSRLETRSTIGPIFNQMMSLAGWKPAPQLGRPMSEQTWTLGALLDWTAKHLAQKGAEFPRLDAEVLLAHAAGCKRIDLYGLRFAEEASPAVRQKFKELIRRRIEG